MARYTYTATQRSMELRISRTSRATREYEIVADAFDELLDTEEYDEIVGEDELDD